MNGPLVSVIMPTFNHGNFIGEAVASVITQTYENWELLVVNNFSTDDTMAVLSAFNDPRIRVENFANGGIIAKSRNRGLSLAAGSYFALLDSDDVWEPEKLAIQVAFLERHSDMLACSTALSYIPGGRRGPLVPGPNRRLSLRSLRRRNLISNSSVLCRTACRESLGYFDEDPELRTIEDYEYWLRALQERDRSFGFIDRPLLRYRISAQNASGFSKKVDVSAEKARFEKLAGKRFSGAERESFLRMRESELARRCLEFGCIDGNQALSRRNLLLGDRLRMLLASFARILAHRKPT